MRLDPRVLLLALVGLLAASARGAAAKDDPDTARAKVLYSEAEKQYSLGRFEDALAAYQQAFLARPLPGLLFNIGQCHRLLGQHKEAVHTYRRFLEGLPDAENRDEVERLIASEEEAEREARKNLAPTGTVASPDKPVIPLAPPPPQVVPQPPLVVTPVAPPPEVKQPVYKKWWLWTLVGGAALVGIAVGIGVAYAVPNDAPAGDGPLFVHF